VTADDGKSLEERCEEVGPSSIEAEISPLAAKVLAAGKTGYNWQSIDDVLQPGLGLATTRCKKASGSGRAANVITESNDKPIDLYAVFIVPPYTAEKFLPAARDRMKRFPNARTVAVLQSLDGIWRVTHLLEQEGRGVADSIIGHFPLVDAAERVPVDFDDESLVSKVVTADVDEFFAAAETFGCRTGEFSDLIEEFKVYASSSGVSVDDAMALDLLASTLGSQFLLFAGPSGTGKSTVASLLCSFFSRDELYQRVETSRRWIGPEDLAGHYSNVSQRFAATANTASLIALHEASIEAVKNFGGGVPMLLVEEINLSAIEGYLGPFTHGLSRLAVPMVTWTLHAATGYVETEGDVVHFPSELMFGPFPRLFGTLNVDQESAVPARKVLSRATVVLLEAERDFDPAVAASGLAKPAAVVGGGQGAPWIGSPDTARLNLGEEVLLGIFTQVRHMLASLAGVGVVVRLSKRDQGRIANYSSYYVSLATAAGATQDDAIQIAVENAIIHFVLPSLEPEVFQAAATALQGMPLTSSGPKSLGGLLGSRLSRLQEQGSQDLLSLMNVDFWAALS
jgi:hypothetical protein